MKRNFSLSDISTMKSHLESALTADKLKSLIDVLEKSVSKDYERERSVKITFGYDFMIFAFRLGEEVAENIEVVLKINQQDEFYKLFENNFFSFFLQYAGKTYLQSLKGFEVLVNDAEIKENDTELKILRPSSRTKMP